MPVLNPLRLTAFERSSALHNITTQQRSLSRHTSCIIKGVFTTYGAFGACGLGTSMGHVCVWESEVESHIARKWANRLILQIICRLSMGRSATLPLRSATRPVNHPTVRYQMKIKFTGGRSSKSRKNLKRETLFRLVPRMQQFIPNWKGNIGEIGDVPASRCPGFFLKTLPVRVVSESTLATETHGENFRPFVWTLMFFSVIYVSYKTLL